MMLGRTYGLVGIGVLTAALLTFASPREAAAAGLCSLTSAAALEACLHEAEDDLFIARGKCNNLRGVANRRRCRRRALRALGGAREECRAQLEARERVCRALGPGPYDPVIAPADFVTPAQAALAPNPYFPLVPGTVFTYVGGTETITVTVTGETKEILGVSCAVVRDVVEDGGLVIEDTLDWYAQDLAGNVWYFGEIAQEFADGELVSIDGSWKAGVDGAKPGIIMFAAPAAGRLYRQEFLLGDAEDVARVASLTGTETVPAAACAGDCLVTRDWSPLEPDAAELKYYAPGVGLILEVDVETGARVELVDLVVP